MIGLNVLNLLNLMLPITASELRGEFYNYKRIATQSVLDKIYTQAIETSKYSNNKSLYVDLTNFSFVQLIRVNNTRIPTIDEVIEVLKTLFLDCKITSVVKDTEYGIEIDWS